MFGYITRRRIGVFFLLLTVFLVVWAKHRYIPESNPAEGELLPEINRENIIDRHLIIIYDHSGSMKGSTNSQGKFITDNDRIDRLNQYIKTLIVDGFDEFKLYCEINQINDAIISDQIEAFKTAFGQRLAEGRTMVTLLKFGLTKTNFQADHPDVFIQNFYEVDNLANGDLTDFLTSKLPTTFPKQRSLTSYATSQYLRAMNSSITANGNFPLARKTILITTSDFLPTQSATGPTAAEAAEAMNTDKNLLKKIGDVVATDVMNATTEYSHNFILDSPNLFIRLASNKISEPIYLSIAPLKFERLRGTMNACLDSLKFHYHAGCYLLNLGFLDTFSEAFQLNQFHPQFQHESFDISDNFRYDPASKQINVAANFLSAFELVKFDLTLTGLYNHQSQFQQSYPVVLTSSHSVPVVEPPALTRRYYISLVWAVLSAILGLVFLFFGLKQLDPKPFPVDSPETIEKGFDGKSTVEIPLTAENDLQLQVKKDGNNIRETIGRIGIGEVLLNDADIERFLKPDTQLIGAEGFISFSNSTESIQREENAVTVALNRDHREQPLTLKLNCATLDQAVLPPEDSFDVKIPLIYSYRRQKDNFEIFSKTICLDIHFKREEGTWKWLPRREFKAVLYYPEKALPQWVGKIYFQNPVPGSQVEVELEILNVDGKEPVIVNGELSERRIQGIDDINRSLSFEEKEVLTQKKILVLGEAQEMEIPIWVNFKNFPMPAHSYQVSFQIQARGAERFQSRDFSFKIYVPLENLSVVAVDFGTSASLVAASNRTLQDRQITGKSEGYLVAEINDAYEMESMGFERDRRLLSSTFVIQTEYKTTDQKEGRPFIYLGNAAVQHFGEKGFLTVTSLKRLIAKRKQILEYNTDKILYNTCRGLLSRAFNEIKRENISADSVREVIVTHPNNFTDAQRQLIYHTYQKIALDGTDIPRFIRIQLLSESDATIYYYLSKKEEHTGKPEVIMIMDVGGGTTDVVVVKVSYPPSERLAQIEHLGQFSYNIGGEILDSYFARILWGIILKIVNVPVLITENLFKLDPLPITLKDGVDWLKELRRIIKRQARQIKLAISEAKDQSEFNITPQIKTILNEFVKLEGTAEFGTGFTTYSELSLSNIIIKIEPDASGTKEKFTVDHISWDNQNEIPYELKPESEQIKEAEKYLAYQALITQYPDEISGEIIRDTFRQYQTINPDKPELTIDTLIIAGRGSCYRRVNQLIIKALKQYNKKPIDKMTIKDLTLELETSEPKTCLVKGAVYFGIAFREQEKKKVDVIFSSFGLIGMETLKNVPYYEELVAMGTQYPFEPIEKQVHVRKMRPNYFWGQVFSPDGVEAIEKQKYHKYALINRLSRKENVKLDINYRVEVDENDIWQLREEGNPMVDPESFFILDNIVDKDLKDLNEEFLVDTFFPETLTEFE